VKISVVTVTMNSARTVAHTLESFLRQSHADRELVVIDGASRDETVDIVRQSVGDNVLLISEPDCGIYDAMNKGLRFFSGEAVGFLNSDDRFSDDDVLSAIASGLEEADIVHGNIDFVAPGGKREIVRRWRGSPFRPGAFSAGWMPPHPTFYVRRRVAEAVGAFDTRYEIGADYDFMLRAMELNGFRSSFVDRVLVEMMTGGTSTRGIAAYIRGNVEAWQSRRAWLGAGVFDAALVAKPLRKLGQFLPHAVAAS
jgi:glycosyltransferase involved in cell wall biosynthesis